MKKRKNVLRKDFYMEIRKSAGRFISIFFIVALGVAFFSGIRVAEPDLRLSGDAYFDRNSLMDIQVQSTMGITKEDIKALREIDGVEKVEAGYSTDVLCAVEGRQQVLHVLSRNDSMNQFVVEEGRMPKAADECLVDIAFLESTSYQIGDTLKLESGTNEDLKDTLKYDEFRIVGSGSSSRYISFGRGSSTIGTGEVSGFLAVDESAFDMDIYTEACILVEGAKEEIAFTDGYETKVEKVIDEVEKIKDYRCQVRDEEIRSAADEEILKAQKELDDGKKQAGEKLSDAKKELLEGERLLNDGKEQIADGKKQLLDGENTLKEKETQWQQGYEEYIRGKNTVETGLKEIETKQKAADEQFDIAEQQLVAARKTMESEFNAARVELEEQQEKCEQARAEIDKAKEGLPLVQKKIEELNSQIDSLKENYRELEEAISKAQTQEEKERLQEELKKVEESLSLANISLEKMEETKNLLMQAAASLPEVEKAEKELALAWRQYEENYAQASGELKAKEQEYIKKKAETTAWMQEAKDQLLSAVEELDGSKGTLDSAKTQLDMARKEIKEQQSTLSKSEQTILEEEKKLEDGKKEYATAEEEAMKEIADGEQKIADAKEELSDLSGTEWYVNDRTVLPEYEGLGQNADRMRAIGQVFPILFFLVAALISLTTMTRMVEEERTQIGTLKALGYSKWSIAKKYLGYALLATFGGSVFGFLAGEKIFPYIIVYAYQIMYPYVPDIVVPYDISYGIQAAGAALLCTGVATGLSCFGELAAQPAVLMRPPAPKQGKRILLERISLIWKHLSFTWKATCRNIFRYKKRFFMTVLGTGGCMALMIVGFGLKDSIYDIGNIQYDELQFYDATAYIKEDLDAGERQEVLDYLSDNPDVADYLEAEMKLVDVKKGKEEKSLYLEVIDEGQNLDPFMTFGNRRTDDTYSLCDTAKDGGAILTEKMAKMLGVEKGDTITVKKDGKTVQVKIGEVCENYMSHYLYMTDGLYRELFGEEPVYNSVMLKMQENDTEKLEETGEELLAYNAVQNVSYTDSLEERLDDMLRSLNLVIVVLIISAGMLAFVVLYNLSNINITERKRELATLKVLGFYDREVSAYVYRENVLLTLIGAVAGCGLGKLLHQYVIVTVEIEEVMFGRNVNLPSFLYSFLFTIAFALFVNWVMYYKLKKIDMVESLKSIE